MIVGAQVVVGESANAFDGRNVQCGATISASSIGQEHTFECSIPGRFVFVRLPDKVVPLHMTEVTVYINDAVFSGGVVDQSSTYSSTSGDYVSGPARYARDKNDKTFTHTNALSNGNSWWRLDTGVLATGSTENDGVCTPCVPGLFQDKIATWPCQSCDKGRHSSASFSSVCDACDKGRYNEHPGQPACQVCVAAGMGMDPVCCTAACSISIEKTNSSRDGSGSPLSHAGAASALAWSRYISRYRGGSVSDARSIPAMRGNRASVSGFHNASPAETSALCQLWQTRSIAKAISPGPARAIATHISEGSLAITVSSSLMGVGVESVSVRERRRGRAAPFRKVWGVTPESEVTPLCEVR